MERVAQLVLQAAPDGRPDDDQLLLGPVQETSGFLEALFGDGQTRFFFAGRQATGWEGDRLGELDELVGQLAEAFIARDALAHGFALLGADPLAEVLAAKPALEAVGGSAAAGFATALGLEALLAQVTAAEAVNGAHLVEDLLTAGLQLAEFGSHGRYCI